MPWPRQGGITTAHEALEDRLLTPCGQATTAIADRELKPSGGRTGAHRCTAFHARRQAEAAAGGRVCEGVVDEVAQHALHQHRINPQQRQVVLERHPELQGLQGMLARLHGAGNQLINRHPLPCKRHRLTLKPRQIEQITRQRVRAQGLAPDRFGERGLRGGQTRPGQGK